MSFRIDHVGIAVRSIAQARKIYEQLGLAVLHEEQVAHEKVNTALIPCGESRIELVEPTSQDSTIQKFLDRRGEGMHHIAIHVDDISETFESLRSLGVRMISDEIKIGSGGHLYVFLHPTATHGVLIELVQDPIAAV